MAQIFADANFSPLNFDLVALKEYVLVIHILWWHSKNIKYSSGVPRWRETFLAEQWCGGAKNKKGLQCAVARDKWHAPSTEDCKSDDKISNMLTRLQIC